ncbi:hypothetical protein PIB30_059112 [Stylosanthes scabra]|uniref:Uncharacterized protein n=1 Tax=Stylosanthes scabra TaxID=79078 RepID=A0ABU6ZIW5_9FABA|nr:hypothetical protein [Stylosanthes scabra]
MIFQIARKGSSPLAKGKAIAYGPPTRTSPRLAAMRACLAANSRPEIPDAPVTPAPPIARRTARISVKYYSMKLVDRDGPSLATNHTPIEIDSDSEEEDPEEDPEEDSEEERKNEQEEEEDPKMDLEGEQKEEEAIEGVQEEEAGEQNSDDDEYDQIYFEDYFELAPSASSDESSTGSPPTNN